MPKINLLDKSVYELIAAGEVIERPSSVIKELAENSIDAGAHTITVEIKRGGITYIRVTDDGCGMSYEDIPKAFLRHATSKVMTADDLDDINTLGFRGEALASVCAVGKVKCVSKRDEDALGTSYCIAGGEVEEYEHTGCADGTTIIIRDLFFNTPARLKFLKKDVTEGNYCAGVVEKLALSHPAVSFRFIRDGRQTMMTGGDGEYYSAVYAVFGKQFAAGLVPAEGIYRDISVQGYVSSPLAARKNRTMQHFFVNGRSVKSPLCSAALEEAFRNTIMVGRFPACVLNINLDPAGLDVNISPTKTEVRFSNEKTVFDAVYSAVKNALLGFDDSREITLGGDSAETLPVPSGDVVCPQAQMPKAVFSQPDLPRPESAQQNPVQQEYLLEAGLPQNKKKKPAQEELPLESYPGFAFLSQKIFERSETQNENGAIESGKENNAPARANSAQEITAEQTRLSFAEKKLTEEKPLVVQAPDPAPVSPERHEQVRVIGEVFKTYIVCESSGSLLLIDKHAAHERINFELFKSGVNSKAQLLLEPREVRLSPKEYEAASNFAGKLSAIGLELDFGEDGVVRVTALPQAMDNADPQDVLESVASLLANGNDNAEGELFDDVLHTMACKASVRGNDDNDIAELAALADRVINDRAIRYCPHGRPVLVQISKGQIERYFGRAT